MTCASYWNCPVRWRSSAKHGVDRRRSTWLLKLSPEVVVMDLEMPGMDGYEATRRIKARHPAPRVVILSVHAGPEKRERARMAGADGFVVKGANYQDPGECHPGKEWIIRFLRP